MKTNGKWAVVGNSGYVEIVERPAETAPGARGSNWINGEQGMGLDHSHVRRNKPIPHFSLAAWVTLRFG
jgi:hypothetical protein